MNGCGCQPRIGLHACRSLGHKRVWSAHEETTLQIHGEMGALRIMPGFDILALQPIANFEGLAEQVTWPWGVTYPLRVSVTPWAGIGKWTSEMLKCAGNFCNSGRRRSCWGVKPPT